MCLGSFNLFPTSFKLFNLPISHEELDLGLSKNWSSNGKLVITEGSGKPSCDMISPDCNFGAEPGPGATTNQKRWVPGSAAGAAAAGPFAGPLPPFLGEPYVWLLGNDPVCVPRSIWAQKYGVKLRYLRGHRRKGSSTLPFSEKSMMGSDGLQALRIQTPFPLALFLGRDGRDARASRKCKWSTWLRASKILITWELSSGFSCTHTSGKGNECTFDAKICQDIFVESPLMFDAWLAWLF